MKNILYFTTKYFVLMIITTLSFISCISTNHITSIDQYAEINEQGKDYHAIIIAQIDSAIVEFAGDQIFIEHDTTHWIDSKTQHKVFVATNTIHRIRFTKYTRGAFEGIAVGAAPGLILVLLVNSGNMSGETGRDMKAGFEGIGVLSSIGGAIIGGIIGGSVGGKTDYEFQTP